MRLKQIKHPQWCKHPRYSVWDFTVCFILHASMPIQLIHYRPKLNSPHHKILGQSHWENPANSISRRQKSRTQTWLKNLFWKQSELTLSRKINTLFVKTIFISLKTPAWSITSVGVRFRSSTNRCATRSSEELKPRNLFDRIVMPLIPLRKDMFKQHVLTKGWGVAPMWYLPNELRWWS